MHIHSCSVDILLYLALLHSFSSDSKYLMQDFKTPSSLINSAVRVVVCFYYYLFTFLRLFLTACLAHSAPITQRINFVCMDGLVHCRDSTAVVAKPTLLEQPQIVQQKASGLSSQPASTGSTGSDALDILLNRLPRLGGLYDTLKGEKARSSGSSSGKSSTSGATSGLTATNTAVDRNPAATSLSKFLRTLGTEVKSLADGIQIESGGKVSPPASSTRSATSSIKSPATITQGSAGSSSPPASTVKSSAQKLSHATAPSYGSTPSNKSATPSKSGKYYFGSTDVPSSTGSAVQTQPPSANATETAAMPGFLNTTSASSLEGSQGKAVMDGNTSLPAHANSSTQGSMRVKVQAINQTRQHTKTKQKQQATNTSNQLSQSAAVPVTGNAAGEASNISGETQPAPIMTSNASRDSTSALAIGTAGKPSDTTRVSSTSGTGLLPTTTTQLIPTDPNSPDEDGSTSFVKPNADSMLSKIP